MKKNIPAKQLKKIKQQKTISGNFFPANRQFFLLSGLILVGAFITFSPALTNQLVNWDDYNYIRDNAIIQSLSWSNIQHIFNVKTFIMGNYHPLTILSYAIEYKLAGSSPFLYHLDNILIHLLNVALLMLLVWLMTKKINATLIAAALFAFHPMRVESVVWAAERKDVLYTFFYFLSLLSYIYYLTREENKVRYYILALLFFLCSILSKGQAVVLPLTFLLIDYWYEKKITAKSIAQKAPFFLLALLFGYLAINAQSSSLTEARLVSHTFIERIMFAFYNITAYLYKMIYPYDLACFYGYPAKSEMLPVYAGAIFTIFLLAGIFLFFRKNKPVMFGTLFFLFTIFIVIQLMPIGNAIIADRYTYIPYTGLFIMAGILLDQMITKKPKTGAFIKSLIVLQLLVFSIASFLQAQTWKNNITLWNRVISHNPKEGVAYNNLAIDYLDNKVYDKAIEALSLSVKNGENYPEVYRAYHNLGKAFSETGKPETGICYYDTSARIEPNYPDAYFGRGLTYTNIGKYDLAIADFTKIINRLRPDDVKSLYSRGMAYNKKGQTDSAIADYTRAVQIKPDYADPYTNRGNILFKQEKFQEAINDYNNAIRYDPGNGMNFMNRSFAYFKMNNFDAALADAEKAGGMNIPVAPEYINDLKRLSGR